MLCRRIHALMLGHSDPRLRHRAYLLLQRIGGRPAHFFPHYSEQAVFQSPAGMPTVSSVALCAAGQPYAVVAPRSTCQCGSSGCLLQLHCCCKACPVCFWCHRYRVGTMNHKNPSGLSSCVEGSLLCHTSPSVWRWSMSDFSWNSW